MSTDPASFPLLSELSTEDPEEATALRQLGEKAEGYLAAQRWCTAVHDLRLGDGVGGVVGVFLARPQFADPSAQKEWVWVVVGDLPSAYLVTDQAPTPASALSLYADLMDDWANWVLAGANEQDDNVFPVNAEATAASATMLLSRTKHLRELIIPWMEEGN